jgi:hypothetical protein
LWFYNVSAAATVTARNTPLPPSSRFAAIIAVPRIVLTSCFMTRALAAEVVWIYLLMNIGEAT